MATEIVVFTYCDLHLQDEVKVEGEPLPPLMTPFGMLVVDLCEDCRKVIPYSSLMELAEIAGRPMEEKQSRAQQPKGEIPTHLRSQCRFCDRNDFKTQGRKMHERRAHGEQLAELEAREAAERQVGKEESGDIVSDKYYCEPCDQTFTTGGAKAGHMTSKAHMANTEALISA